MLHHIFILFFMIGWMFGGFVAAQIAQRVAVPILIEIWGKECFAEPSAFDGGTLGLCGGLASGCLPIILVPAGINLFWSFPLVFVGVSIYGLVWLSNLGQPAQSREWKVAHGRIVGPNEKELHPTFIRERSDYFQTDAYNGYSHYFLELYDDKGKLATNAYTSQRARNSDRDDVESILSLRRLNLIIVWRSEEKRWAEFYFLDYWTPLLCGALDRLNNEERNWWRQWILPQFPLADEVALNREQWRRHLQSLQAAYPEFWAEHQRLNWSIRVKFRPDDWTSPSWDLEWILENASSDIMAMTHEKYEDSVHAVQSGRVRLFHENSDESEGPFVRIESAYGEPKKKNPSKDDPWLH